MGHNLIATIPHTNQRIAELRLTAAKGSKSKIYELLDATDKNNLNSGNGTSKMVYAQQITKAIASAHLLSAEELGFLKAINTFTISEVSILFT